MATDHNFKVKNGLIATGSISMEDALKTTNGRLQLGPQNSGSGIWLDRSSSAQYWFIGLTASDGTSLRFYRGGNKLTLDLNGNMTLVGSLTSSSTIQGTAYKIGATVIVNTNRDLTNIGTISSGAITSSGNITTSGVLQVNVGTASHQRFLITRPSSTTR